MKFKDMPPLLQDIIREQLFFWDWEINPPKFAADEFIIFEWRWHNDGTLYFYLNNKQIDFLAINSVNFEIIKSKKEGKIKIKWGDLICPKPWPENIEWIMEE